MFGRSSKLYSIFREKCPRCHEGDLFESKNPYHFKSMGKMPDNCPVCEQPYSLEPGFYFGATYVSYGLTVAYMVTAFLSNWLFLGFPIMQALPVVLGIFVLLTPVIFRFSRSIYINFFVRYRPELDPKR
jgi:uncharacterized protein (DUF983 family)